MGLGCENLATCKSRHACFSRGFLAELLRMVEI